MTMKILEVKSLAIPDVKVIRFARFNDHRGYFTETFRQSDFDNDKNMGFLSGVKFKQINEGYSFAGTFRGLHFQWNPYMGKLVRCVFGHLIDYALDIRKNSPSLGKIIGYDLPTRHTDDFNEWIWLPPGFAHGILLTVDSKVEYFCSGEYSQGCEASISPLAKDIDWGLCDRTIKARFDLTVPTTKLITDKDKNGLTMKAWLDDKRSDNFIYGKV